MNAADCRVKTHASGYQTLEPVHTHVWVIGHVATEPVTYPGAPFGFYHPVVYLVCQCGATKRSIPE